MHTRPSIGGGVILSLLALALPRLGAAAPQFPREAFTQLDVGLYWFGSGERHARAEPGRPNPYFRPDRPTMIYVHGWESDTTERTFREAYDWSADGGPDLYLAQGWIDAGWNVGVFYWNQLADEPRVGDAEAKIWSVRGARGMRWRDVDGDFHDDGPPLPVGRLFYDHYRAALSGYTGDNVRIVGHSLGNQAAVAVVGWILDGVEAGEIDRTLVPDRLVLLDPYYGSGTRPYLDDRSTGAHARAIAIRAIEAGVLLEIHRTSVLSGSPLVGDPNPELIARAAFSQLKPRYFSALRVVKRHIAAPWHYFWSIQFPPPAIEGSEAQGLSASTDPDRVRALMVSDEGLQHRRGTKTPTPADDVFRARPR